jgi:hypothetical protein
MRFFFLSGANEKRILTLSAVIDSWMKVRETSAAPQVLESLQQLSAQLTSSVATTLNLFRLPIFNALANLFALA